MDSESPEISKLCCRIQGGDREALQEFIAIYGSRLRRRIRGKLRAYGVPDRDGHDVDDIMQSASRRLDEALVLKRLPVGSPEFMESYMLGTALNVACETARRQWRAREKQSEVLQSMAQKTKAEPPATEAAMAVADVLKRLNDDEREFLMLRWRGLPMPAVAEALKVSVAACRKRWQRLRVRIRA